jgi:hypothetical protein
MGYTTDFYGDFEFDEPLTAEQVAALKEFNEQRHGGNTQPFPGMPGFWCQWVASDDGKRLEHDGGEKFYDYVEWLEYLIEHFIKPWGRKLNGECPWQGEENDDRGRIVVKDNIVTVQEGKVVYE